MTEWQPIETAPRDSSWFMCGMPTDYDIVGNKTWWVGTARFEFPTDECPEIMAADGYDKGPVWPTHWRPLPDPPQGTM